MFEMTSGDVIRGLITNVENSITGTLYFTVETEWGNAYPSSEYLKSPLSFYGYLSTLGATVLSDPEESTWELMVNPEKDWTAILQPFGQIKNMVSWDKNGYTKLIVFNLNEFAQAWH